MLMLILAILATVAGALATLTMEVLLLAGSPNSTPQQITQIKWMMLGVAIVGLLGIVGAIWAMALGRHGLAAGIGITPAAAVIILIIVLFQIQA